MTLREVLLRRASQVEPRRRDPVDVLGERNAAALVEWRRRWHSNFVGVPAWSPLAAQLLFERSYQFKYALARQWLRSRLGVPVERRRSNVVNLGTWGGRHEAGK